MSSSVGKSFEDLRREALEPEDEKSEAEAVERGREIMRNSATTTAFAADTSEYGLDYRDELQAAADDRVESAAARFVDYEITELARVAGFDEVRTNNDVEISGDHGETESAMEDLYRAFVMMDRLQMGYTDKRPEQEYDGTNQTSPGRYPNPTGDDDWVEDQMAALEESGTLDPDNLGALNHYDHIFIVNDDWVNYRRGEEPLGVDEEIRDEVYRFLEEKGVAR